MKLVTGHTTSSQCGRGAFVQNPGQPQPQSNFISLVYLARGRLHSALPQQSKTISGAKKNDSLCLLPRVHLLTQGWLLFSSWNVDKHWQMSSTTHAEMNIKKHCFQSDCTQSVYRGIVQFRTSHSGCFFPAAKHPAQKYTPYPIVRDETRR